MLKKDKPNILFIGLGMMGQPMALRLVQAQYPVFVHDANQETVKNYCNKIDAKALLPSEDLSLIDVVITMLPDSEIVEDVILGVDNFPGIAFKLLYRNWENHKIRGGNCYWQRQFKHVF